MRVFLRCAIFFYNNVALGMRACYRKPHDARTVCPEVEVLPLLVKKKKKKSTVYLCQC